MKIGIYSESTRGSTSFGGSELVAVVLAEALTARGHDVEVIHHDLHANADVLARRFGVDATCLSLRYRPIELDPGSKNPLRRHLQERQWYRDITAGYELFVEVAHHKPPVCRGAVGVLYVLFPFYDAAGIWSGKYDAGGRRSNLLQALRGWYHQWNWKARMRSYPLKAAISEFSSKWAQTRWGIDAQVIYPPAQSDDFSNSTKTNLVLSVGRFAGRHVSKKQLEMVEVYKRIAARAPTGWSYCCAGGLGDTPEDQNYRDRVAALAEGEAIAVEANLPSGELKQRYESAKIFWHATGLGEDEERLPEMAEHYGIATAEAMLAGCVPIVIKRGAQPEIVEHGVSGFLWETPEELTRYTLEVMNDKHLRERLAEAARERAQMFTRQRFINSFLEFLKPVLLEP